MHFQPSGINCRPCIYHPAPGQETLLPACGVHYEMCMPSWHACFHLFCNIRFSNEDCMGIHALFTGQGLNTKVAHKIFMLWSFREFPGLIFPLMGPYCLIRLATLKTNSKDWCTEKPWPNPVERYHILQGFRCYPSSVRRQVILIKVNGFLVAKKIKNMCFLKYINIYSIYYIYIHSIYYIHINFNKWLCKHLSGYAFLNPK